MGKATWLRSALIVSTALLVGAVPGCRRQTDPPQYDSFKHFSSQQDNAPLFGVYEIAMGARTRPEF